MGCNVTSIYADQVIGRIYYPDQILTDLRKRDFCQPYQIKNKHQIKKICKMIPLIYGFSQSFCQGFAFTTVLDQNQFLVYNNGRFVIKILKSDLLKPKNSKFQSQMSILSHEDEICAMDVNQNMCVVGLSGGKLVLWDLKFDEVKIQIYLPKPSSSFSSISLTKKYIFVTDTNLPNNIAYCIDIQTTKLKSSAIIDSIEPTLKGIRFQENHHVVISAEGLWFMKYSVKAQALQLIKGMFLTFPKTSQSSITSINDKYLVSGGVDGYIYVWNSLYQCIKVIKCFQKRQPITAMNFSKEHNTLILGSMEGKIKCFSFSIKLKPKKIQDQTVTIQNDRFEMEQDIEYLLTQALDEEFGIQNIVTSYEDTLIYLVLNCRGSMVGHLLPTSEPYPAKIKHLANYEIMRFSRKGEIIVSMLRNVSSEQSKSDKFVSLKQTSDIALINVYPKGNSQFSVDRLKTTESQKWLTVESKTSIKTQERNQKYSNFYSFCKTYNSVAYIAQNWIIIDSEPLKHIGFSLNQQIETMNKLSLEIKHLKVLQLSLENILIGLNYLEVYNSEMKVLSPSIQDQSGSIRVQKGSSKAQVPLIIFLFVTFEDQCNVFEVKNKTEYTLHTNVKFLKGKFNNFTIQSHLLLEEPNSKSQEPNQNIQQIHTEVQFNQNLNIWQLCRPVHQKNIQILTIEQEPKPASTHDSLFQILDKIHCSYVKTSLELQTTKITIGGSSIIFWDLKPNTLQ